MSKLAGWFETRPQASESEPLVNIIYGSRQTPGAVRRGDFAFGDGSSVPAKILYCGGSPEVWLAKFDYPAGPEYGIFSWYGMHAPSRQILTSDGTAKKGECTRIDPSRPLESEAYGHLYSCEQSLRAIDLAARITQKPQYRDEGFINSVDSTLPEYFNAIGRLQSLPMSIVMAFLAGNSEVSLGSTWPNNYRAEPYFGTDGAFNLDILERAVPATKTIFDALAAAGFEPKIKVHRDADDLGDRRAVPGIEVVIQVSKALSLLTYEISAPTPRIRLESTSQ